MLITTKLQRLGNSTGVAIPRKILACARLELGDEVLLSAEEGKIEITKAEEGYNKAMEIGRAFSQRYRRLSKPWKTARRQSACRRRYAAPEPRCRGDQGSVGLPVAGFRCPDSEPSF